MPRSPGDTTNMITLRKPQEAKLAFILWELNEEAHLGEAAADE